MHFVGTVRFVSLTLDWLDFSELFCIASPVREFTSLVWPGLRLRRLSEFFIYALLYCLFVRSYGPFFFFTSIRLIVG